MKFPYYVNLIPTHPKEGMPSMLKYWMMLDNVSKNDSSIFYKSCYKLPTENMPRCSRAELFILKYIQAPILVKNTNHSNIIHILAQSSAYLIPHIPKGKKTIVTLHDLIPLRDSSELSKSQLERFKRCVSNLHLADHIACDSEYSRKEANELIGISLDKMTVIPLGAVCDRNLIEPKDRTSSSSIRILSVGTDIPRKNLKIIPHIIEYILMSGYEVELWRVGALLREETRSKLSQFDPKRFRFREFGLITESQLSDCYKNVDCTIVPSLLEGFGLPVLESMANNCPVVSSNATSLPEVGGNAALYFNPNDAEVAAKHILHLKNDQSLRNELISRGRDQVAIFSWENHLMGLKKIYELLSN